MEVIRVMKLIIPEKKYIANYKAIFKVHMVDSVFSTFFCVKQKDARCNAINNLHYSNNNNKI